MVRTVHNLYCNAWAKKNNTRFRKCKFIFSNRFSGDTIFSFLVSFAFFGSCFIVIVVVCLLFFEIKNVYSDTNSIKRAAE